MSPMVFGVGMLTTAECGRGRRTGLVQSQCWCFGEVVLLCVRCAEEWVHRVPDVNHQECGEGESDNRRKAYRTECNRVEAQARR
jgi:hypothetical protein